MIPLIALLILPFTIISCQSNIGEQSTPENLITEERIRNILYDVSILESAINARYGQLSKHHKITKASIDNYLEKEGVDTVDFKASLYYYHGAFEKGISLYDLILDSLTLPTKK